MGAGGRGVPVVEVSPAQAMTLGTSLDTLVLDDEALRKGTYQRAFLAEVENAAQGAFDDLVRTAEAGLGIQPWMVILRGLPVESAAALLVAVSAALGDLIEPYRQPWSRVVRRIAPATDRSVAGRVLNEYLHTDGTDWVTPNDYTCLFCVRPDQGEGGESRLIDVATLLDELSGSAHADLIHRLSTRPVPWRIADELGCGVHWQPIFDRNSGRGRWLRYTITLSVEDGLAMIPGETLDEIWRSDRRRDVLSRVNERECFKTACPHNSRGHHHNRVFHQIEQLRRAGQLDLVRQWVDDLREVTFPLGHSFFV